jgi:DNA-directed RNA polymerase specialized sigma24 family protein
MRFQTPDGENIVQELFVALFASSSRGGRRDNLRAWLFSVAHNMA